VQEEERELTLKQSFIIQHPPIPGLQAMEDQVELTQNWESTLVLEPLEDRHLL